MRNHIFANEERFKTRYAHHDPCEIVVGDNDLRQSRVKNESFSRR